jgi:hypothetical protein
VSYASFEVKKEPRLKTDMRQSLTPESKAGSTHLNYFVFCMDGILGSVAITVMADIIFALCSIVFRIRNYLDWSDPDTTFST